MYYRTEHLVAANDLIELRPRVVRKLIRALLRAEQFARENPDVTIRLLADKLVTEQENLAETWTDYDLTVALDQSILGSMEDQARWAIDAGLTEDRQLPNFLDCIYLDGLRAIQPDAVTVIH